MPQVHVDPDELEHFARNLKQFNSELASNTARLRAQFTRLGETWRDQEHAHFAQEFQQTMAVLDRFSRTSEIHIPMLFKKARIIRDFIRLRH